MILVTGLNNYYAGGKQARGIDQWDAKLDENINDANRFFVRASRRNYSIPAPTGTFPADLNFVQGGSNQSQIGTGASADYVRNWTPSFISELRWGFGRALAVLAPTSYGFDPTTLGFPAYIRANVDVLAFPAFNPSGYLSIGNGGPD